MGQLRTAKAGDVGAFPGSKFVVDNTPPISQCQEARIEDAPANIIDGQPTVTKVGSYAGIDLAGKTVMIGGTTSDDGTYNILSNTDDVLTTDHTFQTTEAVPGLQVKDVGQTYLTRNEASFIRFIESQGKAHTTKGGQLYTDTPSPPLNAACSDTFDPQ